MLYCLSFKHKVPINSIVIDCTSNSKTDGKWFSPFYLGPCELYDGYVSTSIENGYQYSKLYSDFADADNNPTAAYWEWAIKGWNNPKPIKYPLGAWRTPICHLWEGRKLNSIEARKEIFVPLYIRNVVKTEAFCKLKALYERTKRDIILLCHEGYNHRLLGLDWDEVLNHQDFKMGQGFVLCMMLENYLKY